MDEEFSRRLEKIEAQLNAALPDQPASSWITENFSSRAALVPSNLVLNLTRPSRDLLNRGGKRWRPLLMLLCCEALGGGERALPLAPLVELAHNASLIHDDIEDGSEQRRGQTAIHLLYGTDVALNAASCLYFLAAAVIDRWPASDNQRYRAYQLWAEGLRRLHLGQAMDIAWHQDQTTIPALDDYYLMCRLKTGGLAGLAAVLGALAADADQVAGQQLGTIAEDLGVGFQIIDDVKNLNSGNPGKNRGDDIVEGKKSLPLLLYLHKYPAKQPFVVECFTRAKQAGPDDPVVEELIAELQASGQVAVAQKRGEEIITSAVSAFNTALKPSSTESERACQLLSGLIGGLS